MAEKPKLTLESALAEFPKECRAVTVGNYWVLIQAWVSDRDSGHPLAVDLKEKEILFHALHVSALQWLEGRKAIRYFLRLCAGVMYWPADPLRRALEEVQRQLKREQEG